MARPERFERPTPKFVAWCSIQLSYGRAVSWELCPCKSGASSLGLDQCLAAREDRGINPVGAVARASRPSVRHEHYHLPLLNLPTLDRTIDQGASASFFVPVFNQDP